MKIKNVLKFVFKALTFILALTGCAILLGSIGAYETNSITLLRCIFQEFLAVVSFGLAYLSYAVSVCI